MLRAAGAAVLLFVACGLAPARLLAPPELKPWAPLLALPLGACVAAWRSLCSGALAIPLEASLVVLVAGGLAAALLTPGGGEVAFAPGCGGSPAPR